MKSVILLHRLVSKMRQIAEIVKMSGVLRTVMRAKVLSVWVHAMLKVRKRDNSTILRVSIRVVVLM